MFYTPVGCCLSDVGCWFWLSVVSVGGSCLLLFSGIGCRLLTVIGGRVAVGGCCWSLVVRCQLWCRLSDVGCWTLVAAVAYFFHCRCPALVRWSSWLMSQIFRFLKDVSSGTHRTMTVRCGRCTNTAKQFRFYYLASRRPSFQNSGTQFLKFSYSSLKNFAAHFSEAYICPFPI
jgi:hypothetical protein